MTLEEKVKILIEDLTAWEKLEGAVARDKAIEAVRKRETEEFEQLCSTVAERKASEYAYRRVLERINYWVNV